MKEFAVKAALSAGIAFFAAALRALAIPLIVLILAVLADYATGMARAWITKSFSSRTGLTGIVKKCLYPVLVAVGLAADYLMSFVLGQAGISPDLTGLVCLTVTVWLIINEMISILENLAQSGVPVPAFLTGLIARLKLAAEPKGEDKTKK